MAVQLMQEWHVYVPAQREGFERQLCQVLGTNGQPIGGFTLEPTRYGRYLKADGTICEDTNTIYRIACDRVTAVEAARMAREYFGEESIYLRDLGTFGGCIK